MQITINNTKTANYIFSLVTSVMNKRDPMMNQAYQNVYVKAEDDKLTFESGDAGKKQRYVISPETAGIHIDENGEMLISEAQISFAMSLPNGTVIKSQKSGSNSKNNGAIYDGSIIHDKDGFGTETKFRFCEGDLELFPYLNGSENPSFEMSVDDFCKAVRSCAYIAGKEDNVKDSFRGRITVMKKGENVIFSTAPTYCQIMADYAAQVTQDQPGSDFCTAINANSAKRIVANVRAFASLTKQNVIKISLKNSGLFFSLDGADFYTTVYAGEEYTLDTTSMKKTFEEELKPSLNASFVDVINMAARINKMTEGKCCVNMKVDEGKAEFRLINSSSGLLFRETIPAETQGSVTEHVTRFESRILANNLLTLPKAEKVSILFPDNEKAKRALITSGKMSLYMMEYLAN